MISLSSSVRLPSVIVNSFISPDAPTVYAFTLSAFSTTAFLMPGTKIRSRFLKGSSPFGIMKGSVAFQIGPFFSDVNSKFGVLVAGTAGIGIADLVEGIFNIIAFGGTSVGSLVIAVILIVMAWLMVSGGKVAGNVIWIILLIIYIIGIIVSAIASLVLVGIPSLLLFIMLLLFLLSPEVKSKMGMN